MASRLAFVQAGLSPSPASLSEILTDEAQEFLLELHERFEPARLSILEARSVRRQPGFLPSTEAIRRADWSVGPPPADLSRRQVEITGPADRKMMIHALSSGADVFMADFEDALSPTWRNIIEGQMNVKDAVGRRLPLPEKTATLVVRPRGWHLLEQHALAEDTPVSASLFDFGMFFFHNARALIARGSGPYLYLPKLEGHTEARLWNEVFLFAQDALRIPRGTIKATVLIETLPAAFEMQEILFELRDHAIALNAGRWDYLFSVIKEWHPSSSFNLPDRAKVTMTVPFMRAYAKLLVATCKARGAQAIGGMAAFVPSRKDPEATVTAIAQVLEDKRREAADGFDGTWVAHPDLVPVARQAFAMRPTPPFSDRSKPHRESRAHKEKDLPSDERAISRELLDFRVPGGKVTEAGVTLNIDVTVRYLSSWLSGTGAVLIRNLMEDAATAEISRCQLWLWVKRGVPLENGAQLDSGLFDELLSHVVDAIPLTACPRKREAAELLRDLVLSEELPDFLTLDAYPLLAFATGVAA